MGRKLTYQTLAKKEKEIEYGDIANLKRNLLKRRELKSAAVVPKVLSEHDINKAFKGEIGWIEQKIPVNKQEYIIKGATKDYKYEITYKGGHNVYKVDKITTTVNTPEGIKNIEYHPKHVGRFNSDSRVRTDALLASMLPEIRKNPEVIHEIAKLSGCKESYLVYEISKLFNTNFTYAAANPLEKYQDIVVKFYPTGNVTVPSAYEPMRQAIINAGGPKYSLTTVQSWAPFFSPLKARRADISSIIKSSWAEIQKDPLKIYEVQKQTGQTLQAILEKARRMKLPYINELRELATKEEFKSYSEVFEKFHSGGIQHEPAAYKKLQKDIVDAGGPEYSVKTLKHVAPYFSPRNKIDARIMQEFQHLPPIFSPWEKAERISIKLNEHGINITPQGVYHRYHRLSKKSKK